MATVHVGLIDDHDTLVRLEADHEVSEGSPDVAEQHLGASTAKRKALPTKPGER